MTREYLSKTMINFLNRFRRKSISQGIPDLLLEEVELESNRCLNCGDNRWYEGPSGGLSINIKCVTCGLWFNSVPFGGLDFIGIKENVGEHKKRIVWYCPSCNTTEERDVKYGKYPSCHVCDTSLKVCWSYKDFPSNYCEQCNARFKCLTTRGSFND